MGFLNLFRTKRYQFGFLCRRCGHKWVFDGDHVYPEMNCRKCGNHCLPYKRHDREGPCAK